MDLKQYKAMIANQILNSVHKQVAHKKAVAKGSYHNVAEQIEALPKQSIKKAKAVKKILEPEVKGGTIHHHHNHFLKHLGKSVKHVANDVSHVAKKEAVKKLKNVAQKGKKMVIDHAVDELKAVGMKAAQEMATYAPEIGETALEYAPLLLAAGMTPKKTKKVKRSRVLSAKEKNRHALVRQLMSEHGCTLCEASKHIKENNISY